MIRLLLATRNAHKTREFTEMLGEVCTLLDMSVHPEIGEVVEDGATFAENAQLKAVIVSRQVAGLVLADDSGLEVDSLGGAPGIFSARYSGPGATDATNRQKLLAELARLAPGASRAARFRCVLVLARAGEVVGSFEGAVEGQIFEGECGSAGFGYDPLFQPDGFDRSFAQLAAIEKNQLSHRAMAVRELRDFLKSSPPSS
ncbi:MAG: RdgB/HAM1 family non-canonical purine NTP pyrophosphatase [Spartobacteria bacterium]